MTCDSLQGRIMDRELVWLFVRGDESVRISRPVAARAVFVCGPGRKVDMQSFDSPESLGTFLAASLTNLEKHGWSRLATVDRRKDQEPLPPGGDRRR